MAIDGETWFDGRVLLVAVANGSSFGRGMRVAPGAVVDDGEAELVVIEAMPKILLPLRLPRLYFGTHLALRQVHHRRVRALRIEPSQNRALGPRRRELRRRCGDGPAAAGGATDHRLSKSGRWPRRRWRCALTVGAAGGTEAPGYACLRCARRGWA